MPAPRVLRLVEQAGDVFMFFMQVLSRCHSGSAHRGQWTFQVVSMGISSLPLIVITGLFTGLVLAVQTFTQLHKLGAETLTGPIVGVGIVSELGPVLAALMLSSRVGGAMAAELGTMKVTEQIDALRVFGTDPIRHLVVPRFLACLVISPLLTLFADVIGVAGGYAICTGVYHIDPYYYMEKTREFLTNFHLVTGMVKSVVFGGIISICCCWRGLITSGGAENVGRATTQANVLSAVGILMANFFLTVFMQTLRWRLFS